LSDDGTRTIEDAVAVDPGTTPLIAQVTGKGHRIGAPDETNFEYGLECILEHASQLIEKGAKAAPKAAKATARKSATRARTKSATPR
jgi:hypothetical protein